MDTSPLSAFLKDGYPVFLEKTIGAFPPDGRSYELVRPLTDLRSCHYGTPAEARIVFICRTQTRAVSASGRSRDVVDGNGEGEGVEEFVMKVKVQLPPSDSDSKTIEQGPDSNVEALTGPSTTTTAEIGALTTFTKAANPYVPYLVAFKTAIQPPTGPFPGGYLTFMVMTRMPGQSLFDAGYWSLTSQEREEIVTEYLKAISSIYALSMEPMDCALRNVLWERETKKCSIIDFELWRETTANPTTSKIETKQLLQRWGLERRPPPKDWWSEWNRHF